MSYLQWELLMQRFCYPLELFVGNGFLRRACVWSRKLQAQFPAAVRKRARASTHTLIGEEQRLDELNRAQSRDCHLWCMALFCGVRAVTPTLLAQLRLNLPKDMASSQIVSFINWITIRLRYKVEIFKLFCNANNDILSDCLYKSTMSLLITWSK